MMSVTLGEDLCRLLCVHINRSGLTRKRKGEREKRVTTTVGTGGVRWEECNGLLEMFEFFLVVIYWRTVKWVV